MKKWHMESILQTPDSYNVKLSVPVGQHMNVLKTSFSLSSHKEFPLVVLCRRLVAYLVKHL